MTTNNLPHTHQELQELIVSLHRSLNDKDFDEVGIEREVSEEPQDTVEVKSHQRQKHPVRKPIPADLPREKIIYDLKEEEKVCDCGTSLSKIGEEITEQLKYIPAQLSVIQHVRISMLVSHAKTEYVN